MANQEIQQRNATRLSTIIMVDDSGYAFGTYDGVYQLKLTTEGTWALYAPDGELIRVWRKRVSKQYAIGVALTAVMRRSGVRDGKET